MVKVKAEYKDTVVAFNDDATALGKRDDLHLLAEIALESGDESLIVLFEKLPTLEEIKDFKGKLFVKNK